MALAVVALIGSPNVGKSTIFNRIIGRKRSIVDDQAGITREGDVIIPETFEYNDKKYNQTIKNASNMYKDKY